jgi:Ca2+-binding RTX toxin-like protein
MGLRLALPIALAASLLALVLLGGPVAGATSRCGGKAVTIPGTDGNDRIKGTQGDDVIEAGAGADTIDGKGGDDRICGGEGFDTLVGGSGDDTLEPGGGDDVADGGAGSDTAVYARESKAVIVDLAKGSTIRAAGRDSLPSIENLTGSRFGDTLYGDGGPNVLRGGPGDDRLVGRGGEDTLLQ